VTNVPIGSNISIFWVLLSVKMEALNSTENLTPACHSSPKPAQRNKKGIKS
jgi:hypothetical protein